MYYATTEKVIVAWIASLPGFSTAMVNPTLPSTPVGATPTWATTGFITPYAAGGLNDVSQPLAHPVVGLKCWAVDPTTGLPPWNQANNLAEAIRAGTKTRGINQVLTLPNCDQDARILSVYMLEEPRRSFGDTGDYACFDTTVEMHWSALPRP